MAESSAGDILQPSRDFDALWDYDEPAATERRLRELLADRQSLAEDEYRAELLTQIARAEGLQRKFDDAHRTLDRVSAMLDDQAVMPVAPVRYLLERGRVFNSSRRPNDARPQFIQAWETAQREHLDGYAVDAAHMMGIVESGDESLRWNERAFELAQASVDPAARKWLGSLSNNIGWTCHDQGEYEKALKMFENALRYRQQQGDEKTIRIAQWCIARCLRSLGRADEALLRQRELEAGFADADIPQDGFVFEEIAECLLAQGEEAGAQPHFARAYQLLSKDQWLKESEPARINRLAELGGAGR